MSHYIIQSFGVFWHFNQSIHEQAKTRVWEKRCSRIIRACIIGPIFVTFQANETVPYKPIERTLWVQSP